VENSLAMDISMLQHALLWCGVINYCVLILWILLYLFAGDCMYRIGKLYRLPREQFDALQVGGIIAYKLAVIFFNLVPFVVLRFIV
jgi:hypothetical protein